MLLMTDANNGNVMSFCCGFYLSWCLLQGLFSWISCLLKLRSDLNFF